jgi:phage major head subunit gpT-like protein
MAKNFMVMVAPSLWKPAVSAIYAPLSGAAVTSMDQIRQSGLNIVPVVNARMATFTDKFVVFRTDSEVKPLIRQQEENIRMKSIAEGTELEFNEDKHHYGIDSWRNVGYGLWQHACHVTMT